MALLSIGELAQRAGVAPSALRYYEQEGLLTSLRSNGGQRQYKREVLRRIGFIRAAQVAGLNLEQIKAAFASLPEQRTPTPEDWQILAASWQPLIDERIAALTALKTQLTSCIGCGCLSMEVCALYNPADRAALRGSGARYLLGDKAST